MNTKPLQLLVYVLLVFVMVVPTKAQPTRYGSGAGTGGDASNSFFGRRSGNNDNSGSNNTFIGDNSGNDNTFGNSNTFIGSASGRDNYNAHGNVYVGFRTGFDNTSGSYNVFLGYETGYEETGSNKLYIDNSRTSNPLIWGDFSNDHLKINGKLETTGNLQLNPNGYIDDDVTFGGHNDDWIRLNGYIELKSNTDNYGIVLRNRDANDYFALTQVDGSSYLTENSTHSNYFIKGTNRDTYFGGRAVTTRKGISGTYNSSQVQGIWSIGTSWTIDETNNNFGNQYGLVYAHTNSGQGISGWGHQIMFVEDGMVNASTSLSGHGYFKGNLGIGVTNPVYKLDVNGPVNATELRVNGEILNVPTQFWNQTGTDIDYIAGKVGIGTATPLHTLDVNGALNATEIRLNGEIFNPTVWAQSGTDINYLQGTVGIGTATVPMGYRMAVDGNIVAEEIQIQLSDTWPDYVFEEDYDLKPLSEVEAFVKTNKHLPDVPSAKEVAKEGQRLGEMNAILLKKVEELTLYLIEQQETIANLIKTR